MFNAESTATELGCDPDPRRNVPVDASPPPPACLAAENAR